MTSIQNTIILVKAALSGQKDKQGVSKFEHCLRVANNVDDLVSSSKYSHFFPTSEENNKAYKVALLHDILEDSDLEPIDLRLFGYEEDIIEAVELLTHDNNDCSYPDYINSLCNSGNVLALIGKLGDNFDNDNEKRLDGLDEAFKRYLTKRYSGVREQLVKTLENL